MSTLRGLPVNVWIIIPLSLRHLTFGDCRRLTITLNYLSPLIGGLHGNRSAEIVNVYYYMSILITCGLTNTAGAIIIPFVKSTLLDSTHYRVF